MANPNKAKGNRFELDITKYLQEIFGRQAHRPHAEGYVDVGDVHLSPFVLQAKNYSSIATALNVGLVGAEAQAVHANEPFGAVVIKKRGAHISQARVAMTLSAFRNLVERLRRAESLLARHAPEVFHTEHLPPPEPEQDDAASQTS